MKAHIYNEFLAGCRFCPMCKPFGEVSNLTHLEIHTTRIRAMFIWQVINGFRKWDSTSARVVFESTLDSASQTWCVNNYPVSNYILAARADIVDAGFAPVEVMDYQIPVPDTSFFGLTGTDNNGQAVLFYPGDALVAGDSTAAIAALKMFSKMGVKVELPLEWIDSGALAFCLGRQDISRQQAKKVILGLTEAIKKYQAEMLVVDGPLTQWMLNTIYPQLGPEYKLNVPVESIYSQFLDLGKSHAAGKYTEMVSVYALISEFTRLAPGAFNAYKGLLDRLPVKQLMEPTGGLELSDSSGTGGALHIHSPHLSQEVSKARIVEGIERGATCITIDSPMDAMHLSKFAYKQVEVYTPLELMIRLIEGNG
jgi:Fe-S oxidoreductase